MKIAKRMNRTLVIAMSALLLLVSTPVFAATQAATGNGMRVAPVKDDTLVMQPGSSKTVSVFITNVTDKTTTYKVIRNDFIASTDESGAPALLLNGEANDKHGLKRYMTAVDSVIVKPGQQREIKVTIAIPKDAAGGGYYGAIRFAPVTSAKDNVNVALSGSVASLILVRVPGDVLEKLSLVSFDARRDGESKVLFTSNKKIQAVVRFRNEGNVQEQPFGKILLKKGGKVIGTYAINDNQVPGPGNILPDSVRKFSVDLNKVGSFGKFTIEGNFGYGSDGQLLTARASFYVIPIWLIVLVASLIVVTILGVIVLPRAVKGYNKRILRRAGRR